MHYHDHFWWRFFPKKELQQIYISVAIRSLAVSLISLFIPLYLYKERGYTLEQTLLFFVFYAVIFAVCTPVAAKFSAKYGVKHAILFSVPFFLVFTLLLYWLTTVKTPLVIISALLGISLAFYWMGMHEIFYYFSDREHRGEEFGKRAGISIIATLFGPLIGGFLIKFFGFSIVFLLVVVLLFISALFLFLSKEEHVPYHFSLRSLLNREHWKDSLFFVSRGMSGMAGGVVWPLFIFLILKDYLSLGIVGSLLAGVSGILIWVMGKFSDRIGKRRLVRWTIGFESLSWIIMALVSTSVGVFGATGFRSVTRGLVQSPLGALEYDKAKGDIAGYFVSREVFICLGRILLLTFILMTDSLSGGLIFNGVASLAALLF